MSRRTPPRPQRPTVGNTVGLTTRFSGGYPINEVGVPYPRTHRVRNVAVVNAMMYDGGSSIVEWIFSFFEGALNVF